MAKFQRKITEKQVCDIVNCPRKPNLRESRTPHLLKLKKWK